MALDRVYMSEGESKDVAFTLTDTAGVAIPLSSLVTARLTLYDVETFEAGVSPTTHIINGRELQDILNTNNVVIHSTSGLVTWTMQAADNPIVTERRQVERHRAVFQFTTATAALPREIEIEVKNLNTL